MMLGQSICKENTIRITKRVCGLLMLVYVFCYIPTFQGHIVEICDSVGSSELYAYARPAAFLINDLIQMSSSVFFAYALLVEKKLFWPLLFLTTALSFEVFNDLATILRWCELWQLPPKRMVGIDLILFIMCLAYIWLALVAPHVNKVRYIAFASILTGIAVTTSICQPPFTMLDEFYFKLGCNYMLVSEICRSMCIGLYSIIILNAVSSNIETESYRERRINNENE